MSTEIVAPMPGTIIEILVKEGEEVLEYQEVVILEAMKMENAIPTPEAGKVKEIKVNVDDKVSTNQVLIVLESVPLTSSPSPVLTIPVNEVSRFIYDIRLIKQDLRCPHATVGSCPGNGHQFTQPSW